jgi:hypothetical protein
MKDIDEEFHLQSLKGIAAVKANCCEGERHHIQYGSATIMLCCY